jgi:uncharacterized cupredoxin-like copper-binding protein
MMRKSLALVGLVVLAVSTACSQAGESEGEIADDEMRIEMRDTLFEPNEVAVRRGQEVTFRFENEGELRHDAFIGDEDAQDMHEDEMRMSDDEDHGAGHVAEEEDAITVEPGESGTLTYRFTKRGETIIGCHEPGHYASGMHVSVNVT